MKKLSILLIVIMLFSSLTGCSGSVKTSDTATPKPYSSSYSKSDNQSSGSSSYSSKSSSSDSYPCAAYPCPNKITSGTYCSIHAKGKTKKCLICGTSIWDDEKFCDDCLYSSIKK